MINDYELLAKSIAETYFKSMDDRNKERLHIGYNPYEETSKETDREKFVAEYLKVYSLALKNIPKIDRQLDREQSAGRGFSV